MSDSFTVFRGQGFFVAKNRYICLYMIPSRHIVFLYYSSIEWRKQLKFISLIYITGAPSARMMRHNRMLL